MSLFSFDPQRTLTGLSENTTQRGARGINDVDAPFYAPSFSRDDGTTPSREDLENQFMIYQINREPDGPALLDSNAVTPGLGGSVEEPDVLVRLNMVSFHLGTGENVDADTRATMRVTFGRDPSASDRMMDTAFWAVAAGMKLYNEYEGKAAQDKQLSADMNRAFANRPVEIPGGLGLLSFEVVRHRDPPWWRKLFDFAQSGTGKAMTSVLGFPAITQSALSLVDELLGRLGDEEPDVLFKSAPLRLALSQYAHDEFTGGNCRIRLGSLTDGYCILARGRDRETLGGSNPVFYPTHGLLAPASADPSKPYALTRDNPLHDLTYAVFRVKTKATSLDPDFSFR